MWDENTCEWSDKLNSSYYIFLNLCKNIWKYSGHKCLFFWLPAITDNNDCLPCIIEHGEIFSKDLWKPGQICAKWLFESRYYQNHFIWTRTMQLNEKYSASLGRFQYFTRDAQGLHINGNLEKKIVCHKMNFWYLIISSWRVSTEMITSYTFTV